MPPPFHNWKVSINIDGNNLKKKKEQKVLGIKFNSSLSFEGHIISLFKKASLKLHALAKIVSYMDFPKGMFLMKAFITLQFQLVSIKLNVTK